MEGYELLAFKERLFPLAENEGLFPISVKDKLLFLPSTHDNSELVDMFFSREWLEILRELPLRSLLEEFSFNELARINYDDPFFFCEKITRFIGRSPQFRLLQKIKSSFCEWGSNNDHTTWNTAIDVYEQIRTFSIPLADFEVSVDWTIGHHPRGNSEKHHVYLDGVFAYYVRYRGVHVLTIGFSFTDKGELLLQQVQLVKNKGNRFLYSLPCHYIEWVTELFRSHFSGRDFFIAEGKSLAHVIESAYVSLATRHRDEFKRHRSFLHTRMSDEEKKYVYDDLEYHHKAYKEYWKKLISFRSKDLERIILLYGRIPCKKVSFIRRKGLVLNQILEKPA